MRKSRQNERVQPTAEHSDRNATPKAVTTCDVTRDHQPKLFGRPIDGSRAECTRGLLGSARGNRTFGHFLQDQRVDFELAGAIAQVRRQTAGAAVRIGVAPPHALTIPVSPHPATMYLTTLASVCAAERDVNAAADDEHFTMLCASHGEWSWVRGLVGYVRHRIGSAR